VIEGEVGQDDYTGGIKMTATAIHRIEEARTMFCKCLIVSILKEEEALVSELQSILKAYPGTCVVQIRYANQSAKAAINLGISWRVNPCDELLHRLFQLLDERRVFVSY